MIILVHYGGLRNYPGPSAIVQIFLSLYPVRTQSLSQPNVQLRRKRLTAPSILLKPVALWKSRCLNAVHSR